MTTTAQNRMKVISPKEVGDLLSGNLSEYEITALKFLQDTGTTLITKFSRFGKHFIGDTNDRNVFEVTLKNSKHEYTFDFGSSIKDSQKLVEICEWDELKDDDLVEVYAGISHTTKSISGSVKFKYKKSDIVNLNDAEFVAAEVG